MNYSIIYYRYYVLGIIQEYRFPHLRQLLDKIIKKIVKTIIGTVKKIKTR